MIKPTNSQYSNNPQIPEAKINIQIKNLGTDPSTGKERIDIKCGFKGWNK